MKKLITILMLIFFTLTLSSCIEYYTYDKDKINITTTTNIMADLANQIGQERVSVYSLMGAGVDPHQYIARPHDYNALSKADFILVSGLHLEGKMASIIESYQQTSDKTVLLVGDTILENSNDDIKKRFIADENFGNNYDPHFWFDIILYKEAAKHLTSALIAYEPKSTEYFTNNLNEYLLKLEQLEKDVHNSLESIPINERFLISAHDAFEYFGREFNFEVRSLQGLSTEDQVSPHDVKEIVELVVTNKVKAIFPEHSVPNETIKSVSEEVRKKGFEVVIGNNLYSDSLGDENSDNTYIKMYLTNVKNIVDAFTKGV